ncbi:hypothetical protein DFH08DRAFT_1042479, partial [Mycena albidolilacea]
ASRARQKLSSGRRSHVERPRRRRWPQHTLALHAAARHPAPSRAPQTRDLETTLTHSIPCLFFLAFYIAAPDRMGGNAHPLRPPLSLDIFRPSRPSTSGQRQAQCYVQRPYDRARHLPPSPQPPPSHLLAAVYTQSSVVGRLRACVRPVHLPLPSRISLGRAAIPTNSADRQDSAEQLSDRDKRGMLR